MEQLLNPAALGKLFTNLSMLLMLFSVMILTGIYKQKEILNSWYAILTKYIRNKKLLMFLTSIMFQPINPRTFFTAVLLKDMAKDKEADKTKLALFSYTGTHHYYLWSPIEHSVIVICAGLGLTYPQFMMYMWAPLLAYIVFLGIFLIFFVKNDSLKDAPIESVVPMTWSKKIDALVMFGLILLCAFGVIPNLVIGLVSLNGYLLCTVGYTIYMILKHLPAAKQINSFITWRVVGISFAAILLGWGVAAYSEPIVAFFNSMLKSTDIYVALTVGFVLSFLLGHAGRYIGLTVILTSIFGLKYFSLIYMVELAGFIISPGHHSLVVVQQYFGANTVKYYGAIALLGAILIASAALVS
jgi:hypothetical protein